MSTKHILTIGDLVRFRASYGLIAQTAEHPGHSRTGSGGCVRFSNPEQCESSVEVLALRREGGKPPNPV
jgi:hypothetical protein